MSSLIPYKCTLDSRKGKIIYEEGGNLRKISDFMENPNFRQFYKENFKSWSDVQIVVMFMKLYEKVEESNPSLSVYEKISFLEKVMEIPETRRYTVDEMLKWEEGEEKTICN